MGIRRTLLPFEEDYVQIPNAWLRDARLSRRARGLLAELMTHRAGWHITVASLQKTGPEGRDAIRGAVLELAECGYLQRRQTQGAGGRFNEIEYEISDPTVVGFSDTGGFTDDGSADDGSADVGKSTTKKNIPQKTIDSKEDPEEEHSSSPTARDLERSFDQAYANWPKKVERKKSLAMFIKAAKTRDLETLVADVVRFGNAYAISTERRFVPALAVWLNGERWTDELPTPGMPTEADWNAALATLTPVEQAQRPPGPGRRQFGSHMTRGEENLAYLARVQAEEGTQRSCDHKFDDVSGYCHHCAAPQPQLALTSPTANRARQTIPQRKIPKNDEWMYR